jgi:hypothetical protein
MNITREKKKEETLESYIWMKEKVKSEIFGFQTAPTKESHPQYDFIYGPFKTFEDAQRYVDAMGELACGDG